ncbi:hypothetical protein QJQ45_017028, partial [Haematococcus lacustris]
SQSNRTTRLQQRTKTAAGFPQQLLMDQLHSLEELGFLFADDPESDDQWMCLVKRSFKSDPAPESAKYAVKRGRPTSNKELSRLLDEKLAQVSELQRTNTVLRERCDMLDKVLATRDSQRHRLLDVKSGHQHAPALPLNMTYQALLLATPQQLAVLFKHVVNQVGSELVTAGPVPSTKHPPEHPPEHRATAAGDRSASAEGVARPLGGSHMTPPPVNNLVRQLQGYKLVLLVRPDVTLLSGRNANELDDTGPQAASLAPQGMWGAVVLQLQLSPDQARSCWVLAHLHSQWRIRLLEHRALLSQQLAHLLRLPRYGQVYRDPLMTSGSSSSLSESQLLSKLDASVAQERALLVLVVEVFHLSILTHLQAAQLLVLCSPYLPDDYALLLEAAAQHAPMQPPSTPASALAAACTT